MNDILVINSFFNILTKLLFDKVLRLTIFLAKILELLSSGTAIWVGDFLSSNALNLIHG